MKKVTVILLVLCLMLALMIPAAAEDPIEIQLSNQHLTLNGKPVYAQAYNINGSNYFKLRDIAYLLSDTEARFSVEYDSKTNTVTIVSGESYFPIGTELDSSAAAAPKSVKASPQSLIINGHRVSWLSAYNVDASNYFKLRDLGEELGFGVDYDKDTRTVLLTTRDAETLPTESEPEDWSPDISFSTKDADGNEWTDACFRDVKLTMINFWAYWCGPCVREMPDLQRLQDNYGDRGLQILGISYEEYEPDNVAIMEELEVTYPCLRYTYSFDYYLNTGYIPTTIFVDSNGHVVGEVQIGSNSYEGWASIIESLLP